MKNLTVIFTEILLFLKFVPVWYGRYWSVGPSYSSAGQCAVSRAQLHFLLLTGIAVYPRQICIHVGFYRDWGLVLVKGKSFAAYFQGQKSDF